MSTTWGLEVSKSLEFGILKSFFKIQYFYNLSFIWILKLLWNQLLEFRSRRCVWDQDSRSCPSLVWETMSPVPEGVAAGHWQGEGIPAGNVWRMCRC